MSCVRPNWKSERGAMLMHIAIAMLGLLAFSALVIDYGVMWSSRRQIQNSADAAALAGAVSLAYHGANDWDRARLAAKGIGEANAVFGASPNITLGTGPSTDTTQDISFPMCPPGSPGGSTDTCVRVNVYRQAGNLPLPTFFANLFGRTTQDVRATATAKVLSANHSECLKPWAVADRWDETTPSNGSPGGIQSPEFDPDWKPNSTFNPGVDVYSPAGPNTPGTGYRIYDSAGNLCCDYGLVMQLKGDQPYTAMWYQEIDLGNCGNSSSCYRDTISECHGGTIGETVGVKPGVSHGPTDQGVGNLVSQDPDAFWYHPTAAAGSGLETYNPNNVTVPSGLADQCPAGCIYSPTTGINKSPRIGAIPIINPNQLASPPNGEVTIVNLLGFFVIDVSGNGNNQVVRGRVIKIPGDYDSTGGTVSSSASFLNVITLVR